MWNCSTEYMWGTTNYNSLTNKPAIEGITLDGDKSADDLNLVNQKSIVTDLSSLSITLDNVAANTNYFYGTLSSLTITANDDSPLDSNIFFTTDSAFTLNIPNTLKRNWSVSCEGGKKYRLNIYNNIATLNAITDIAPVVIENIADSKTSYWPGYYNPRQTTTSKLKDFGNIVFEVTPGETLYFPKGFTALTCTFFNDDRTENLATISTTNSDYALTVPANSAIKYMSVPVVAGETNLFPITRQPMANYGNLPTTVIHVQPGKPNTKEEITRPTSGMNPVGFYTSLFNYANNLNEYVSGWHALYLETEDAYFCFQGFMILGINPNTYDMLGLSKTGKLYKFASSGFTELSTDMITEIDMRPQETQTSGTNFNTRALRITYGENSIVIKDKFTEEVLAEITYSAINSVLPSGETYETTYNKKAIGVVFTDGGAAYPATYRMATWQSTLPIIDKNSYNPDPEPTESDFPWEGKEWYAYGTSMTDASYEGYAVQLQKITKMNLHNYGKGGSGIIPSLHGGASADHIKSRCMRTSDGKANADLITLEIIPNDMSGTLGESTDTWDETFLGNLNQILQYLQENCPKAQIVVLTATRSRRSLDAQTEYVPTSQNATNWLAWEDGIAEVCRRNCVPFWNGWTACWLWYHRVKAATSWNTYVKDQIHLTQVWAENLAYFFYNKLKDLSLWHTTYDL